MVISRLMALAAAVILCGCAANRVYVNRVKTAAQSKEDEQRCRSQTADYGLDLQQAAYQECAAKNKRRCQEKADAYGQALRRKAFEGCLTALGYKSISQSAARKVQGFSKAWVNADVEFKIYEAAFIGPVDTGKVKLKISWLPDILENKLRPTPGELEMLAQRMRQSFMQTLSSAITTAADRDDLAGKKAMSVSLWLEDVLAADPEANVAAQIFIGTTVSSARLRMRCTVTDAATGEPLVTLYDQHSPNSFLDDNVTMLGTEGYDRWLGAYKVIDLWAVRLTSLIAAKMGKEYKPAFKKKVL